MPTWLVCFMFAIGAATWVFSIIARRTGTGNTKQAFIGAAAAFVGLYIVAYVTLAYVLNFGK